VVIVTRDGKVYTAGDVDYEFSIQSVSKPFTAALVMKEQGPEVLGRRSASSPPAWRSTRSLALAVYEQRSVNPLVNAGAIAAVSLVQASSEAERWNKVLQNISDFAGRPLRCWRRCTSPSTRPPSATAASPTCSTTGSGCTAIPRKPCASTPGSAPSASARDLAVMGATLANGGVNPITEAGDACRARAGAAGVMATAGFYDESGEWMYTAGLPAKTGVGGGIVAVVPGQFAIAAFSPRLNEAGNSVRSMNAIRDIAGELGVGVFGPNPK
jgi:glutaminase